MARTYRAAGDTKKQNVTAVSGAFGTLGVILIASYLPGDLPVPALPIAVTFTLYGIAIQVQSRLISDLHSRGVGKGSWWIVTAVGLAGMLFTLLVIYAIALALPYD